MGGITSWADTWADSIHDSANPELCQLIKGRSFRCIKGGLGKSFRGAITHSVAHYKNAFQIKTPNKKKGKKKKKEKILLFMNSEEINIAPVFTLFENFQKFASRACNIFGLGNISSNDNNVSTTL